MAHVAAGHRHQVDLKIISNRTTKVGWSSFDRSSPLPWSHACLPWSSLGGPGKAKSVALPRAFAQRSLLVLQDQSRLTIARTTLLTNAGHIHTLQLPRFRLYCSCCYINGSCFPPSSSLLYALPLLSTALLHLLYNVSHLFSQAQECLRHSIDQALLSAWCACLARLSRVQAGRQCIPTYCDGHTVCSGRVPRDSASARHQGKSTTVHCLRP